MFSDYFIIKLNIKHEQCSHPTYKQPASECTQRRELEGDRETSKYAAHITA